MGVSWCAGPPRAWVTGQRRDSPCRSKGNAKPESSKIMLRKISIPLRYDSHVEGRRQSEDTKSPRGARVAEDGQRQAYDILRHCFSSKRRCFQLFLQLEHANQLCNTAPSSSPLRKLVTSSARAMRGPRALVTLAGCPYNATGDHCAKVHPGRPFSRSNTAGTVFVQRGHAHLQSAYCSSRRCASDATRTMPWNQRHPGKSDRGRYLHAQAPKPEVQPTRC